MAIDSADKRKSAVNWLRRILPIPDGIIDVFDRTRIAGFYYKPTIIIINESEIINLKSYINISKDEDSTIVIIMNRNSRILKTISRFSKTDSDMLIYKYSIIELEII